MNISALTPEVFFNSLNKNTMHLVEEFYEEKMEFIDPLVHLQGREQMKKYYQNQYERVKSIRFEFSGSFEKDGAQVVLWKMYLQHPSLKDGEEIVTEGVSHFKYNPQTKKVIYHRDFFDLGEYIYENVPVIGFLVKKVKEVAAKESLR